MTSRVESFNLTQITCVWVVKVANIKRGGPLLFQNDPGELRSTDWQRSRDFLLVLCRMSHDKRPQDIGNYWVSSILGGLVD